MPIIVTDEQVAETRSLAERIVAQERVSYAAALLRAARKIAADHRTMPGPILGEIERRETNYFVDVTFSPDDGGYFAEVYDREGVTRFVTPICSTNWSADRAARKWVRNNG